MNRAWRVASERGALSGAFAPYQFSIFTSFSFAVMTFWLSLG
jgi:hypothetical protein